jgi:hypothetical protein
VKRRVALVVFGAVVACTSGASTSSPAVTTVPPSLSVSASVSPSASPDGAISVDVPRPADLVAAFGSVWVQARGDGSLVRIDRTGRVTARISDAAFVHRTGRFGAPSSALADGYGSIWSLKEGALVRVDPSSDRVVDTVRMRAPWAVAAGEGAVWVVYGSGQVNLMRVDPSTMHAEHFVSIGTSAKAFGVGDGYLWWLAFSEGGGMYRIDPRTARTRFLPVGYNQRFIVPTPRWVWLVDSGSAQRIDPADGSLVDARADQKARRSIGVSYSDGTIWMNSGTAVGFDAGSGEVTARVPALTHVKYWSSGGIARLGPRVWLADPHGDRVVGVSLA